MWGSVAAVAGLVTYVGVQKYRQGKFKFGLAPANGPLISWDTEYAYHGVRLCRNRPPKKLKGNILYLYYQTTSSEEKNSKKLVVQSKKIKKPLIPSNQISQRLMKVLKNYKFLPNSTLVKDIQIHDPLEKVKEICVILGCVARSGTIAN